MPRILEETGNRKQDPEESLRSSNLKTMPRILFPVSCFLQTGNMNTYDLGGNRKQETGMPRILEETGNRKQDPEESLRSSNLKTMPRILFPVSCFLQTGNMNTYDLGGNRKEECPGSWRKQETGNRILKILSEAGTRRLCQESCFLFPVSCAIFLKLC